MTTYNEDEMFVLDQAANAQLELTDDQVRQLGAAWSRRETYYPDPDDPADDAYEGERWSYLEGALDYCTGMPVHEIAEPRPGLSASRVLAQLHGAYEASTSEDRDAIADLIAQAELAPYLERVHPQLEEERDVLRAVAQLINDRYELADWKARQLALTSAATALASASSHLDEFGAARREALRAEQESRISSTYAAVAAILAGTTSEREAADLASIDRNSIRLALGK